jgi:hypothetical protein
MRLQSFKSAKNNWVRKSLKNLVCKSQIPKLLHMRKFRKSKKKVKSTNLRNLFSYRPPLHTDCQYQLWYQCKIPPKETTTTLKISLYHSGLRHNKFVVAARQAT